MNSSLNLYKKKKKFGTFQDGIITLNLRANMMYILQGQ